jgi:hypothetical protein
MNITKGYNGEKMFVDGLIFILITKKIIFNKFNNSNDGYSIQNI